LSVNFYATTKDFLSNYKDSLKKEYTDSNDWVFSTPNYQEPMTNNQMRKAAKSFFFANDNSPLYGKSYKSFLITLITTDCNDIKGIKIDQSTYKMNFLMKRYFIAGQGAVLFPINTFKFYAKNINAYIEINKNSRLAKFIGFVAKIITYLKVMITIPLLLITFTLAALPGRGLYLITTAIKDRFCKAQ